ncbi:MAG: SpoIID/LytB domain-containing protein [Fibrobacterota bacterium]
MFTAGSSGLRCINRLPVEEYLKGVVPLEIGRRSITELSAMKAQAVAARTYTYRKMAERRDWEYDLYPSVQDQVYRGVSAEYRGTNLAVEETAREVLVHGDTLVEAYYHSTCGGSTAGVDQVWSGAARSYLQPVSDARPSGISWCASSSKYTWAVTWERKELERIIQKESRALSAVPAFEGALREIEILSQTPSGRVAQCRVTSDLGSWVYGGDRIRYILRRPGPDRGLLFSARFSLHVQGSRITAQGRGYGHGIGLCQMGAIGRARAGQRYREILRAYYRGAKIKKMEEYDF